MLMLYILQFMQNIFQKDLHKIGKIGSMIVIRAKKDRLYLKNH